MRLNQITAPATDLEASIAFYELLGLRLIVKSPHYARFELPHGEATFSLHVVEGEVARENAPQLYFECSDVDFEVRRLKLAGVYEAWLRDPAGNAICIFNAGDNRRYPPWRIDPPPPAKNMHLVIRDGAYWAVVKNDGGAEAWRALQDRYRDYKASLGPFDLFSLLALLEADWPDLFIAHQEKIRSFAAGVERELEI